MNEVDLRVHSGLEVRMRKRGTRDPEAPLYRLADLIDVPRLQGLLDSLNAAFDCPTAIIDNEARVLAGSGWQDICTQFHRIHPETLGECQQSDLHIYGHLLQGNEAVAYVCPRGMIDCASPIVIEGRHLGNVFIGQVFVEPPDLESFRRQARHFGFDEEAYLDAVRRVPIISREELERRLPFVRALAEMIAELGLARLRDTPCTSCVKIRDQIRGPARTLCREMRRVGSRGQLTGAKLMGHRESPGTPGSRVGDGVHRAGLGEVAVGIGQLLGARTQQLHPPRLNEGRETLGAGGDHVGREVDARDGAFGNERLDVGDEVAAPEADFEHPVLGSSTSAGAVSRSGCREPQDRSSRRAGMLDHGE